MTKSAGRKPKAEPDPADKLERMKRARQVRARRVRAFLRDFYALEKEHRIHVLAQPEPTQATMPGLLNVTGSLLPVPYEDFPGGQPPQRPPIVEEPGGPS